MDIIAGTADQCRERAIATMSRLHDRYTTAEERPQLGFGRGVIGDQGPVVAQGCPHICRRTNARAAV